MKKVRVSLLWSIRNMANKPICHSHTYCGKVGPRVAVIVLNYFFPHAHATTLNPQDAPSKLQVSQVIFKISACAAQDLDG